MNHETLIYTQKYSTTFKDHAMMIAVLTKMNFDSAFKLTVIED